MRFAAPEILWLLLVVPLWLAAAAWTNARRRRALTVFAGSASLVVRHAGQVSQHRRAVRFLLFGLAVVFAILALARPQWGHRLEPFERTGADVLFVIDTSLSMAAEDVAPNRLELAKQSARSLLRRLEGERIGLVHFAGRATVACPLTVDRGAVTLFLETLDTLAVPIPGTALADALALATRTLRAGASAGGERGKAIVLFTDGEDHEGGMDEAIAGLKEPGIRVHVLGCGTARGAPIPLRKEDGSLVGYKKDHSDRVVTTRLDEALLESLALESGGTYHRATPEELEIDALAQELSRLEHGEIEGALRARYEERFQIPLILSFLALAAETLLGDRRRTRRATPRAEAA
jgi:Ca-activated chloride channel family protein